MWLAVAHLMVPQTQVLKRQYITHAPPHLLAFVLVPTSVSYTVRVGGTRGRTLNELVTLVSDINL